jgi:hypothetical protein
VASYRRRSNGWELRYRDRDNRERTERFVGGTTRRPPQQLLERKAEVESQMHWGTYVAREDRDAPFRSYFEHWWAARRVSDTRRHTDHQRATKHVLPRWGDWPISRIRPSDIDDFGRSDAARGGHDLVLDLETLDHGLPATVHDLYHRSAAPGLS